MSQNAREFRMSIKDVSVLGIHSCVRISHDDLLIFIIYPVADVVFVRSSHSFVLPTQASNRTTPSLVSTTRTSRRGPE